MIKGKGLLGQKTKERIRRLSPLLKPRTLPRLKHKRLRPKVKRLIPRPRMSLPLSRAKRKTPPRLRSSSWDSFCSFFCYSVSFLFIFGCKGILSMYIMYSLSCLMKVFFFISCSFALCTLKSISIINSIELWLLYL